MKNLIKLEELLLFGLAWFLALQLPLSGWWFWALLLAPDLSMLGYLAGPKAGAVSYNVFHHKGVAVAVFLAGYWLKLDMLQLAGLVLLAHASLDRFFGYGLKFADSFQNTHLGRIGKQAQL